MKRVLAVAVSMLLMASVASAAASLSYSTSGGDTTVTAADGGTQYWKMVVNTDTGSTKGGAIWSFYDLSGNSDPTQTYAHTYVTQDPGLFYSTGAISLDGGVTGLGSIVQGASAMTYTITRTETDPDGTGTAVYSSAVTISAPIATALGYTTNIHIDETITFDNDWDGTNTDGRVQARVYLYSDENDGVEDEWTGTAYNGFPDSLNYQTATATVTGDEPKLAEGSTVTLTNTWVQGDDAYDAASADYGAHGDDYFGLSTTIGITGSWAGNPGPSGSGVRTYTSDTDLDISIIPEPATMGLLGMGLLGLVARRKK